MSGVSHTNALLSTTSTRKARRGAASHDDDDDDDCECNGDDADVDVIEWREEKEVCIRLRSPYAPWLDINSDFYTRTHFANNMLPYIGLSEGRVRGRRLHPYIARGCVRLVVSVRFQRLAAASRIGERDKGIYHILTDGMAESLARSSEEG